MTTEHLNEFFILSTTLSYSETAEKLFISQSTLSRHINSMEKELGVHLFSRTTRNVVLTSEGKIFLAQIPRLIKKAADIDSILHLDSVNASGRIKILYSPQTLNSRILQFFKDFQEQYKDISLDMEPLVRDSDIEGIYNADILISPCDFTRTIPADIDAALVATQSALLALPPYHHFGEERSVSLFDLKNETLIVPCADEPAGPFAQLSFIATRKCYGRIAKIPASTTEQALLLVELGHGVMIIPHHLKKQVYAHTLTIPLSDPECFFPIYVYHNRGNQNGTAVLFFRSISEYFQNQTDKS